MIEGRYFDGITSRAVPASFSCVAGGLGISAEGGERAVPAGDLDIALSGARAPIRIALRDGGLCEMANTETSRALVAALGAPVRGAATRRLGPGMLAALVLLFAAVAVVVWMWGIPLASDIIVDRMPARWDVQLGGALLKQLDGSGVFKPSALPEPRRSQIASSFDALVKPPGTPAYHLELRQMTVPNAFALPGGTIVLGDELVALAPDDTALMTVLGHELGHLQLRHGMRGIVRASLFSGVTAWYLGDISGLLAGAVAGLTALGHSREDEHAADLLALRLMQANGLSTHSAAVLFQRMADWRPGARDGMGGEAPPERALPEYLSTHPDIEGRIELFGGGAAR